MSTVRVLGYCRVSTDEQYTSGAGLAAQKTAITAECESRGWQLLRIVGEDAGASSKTLDRAGLQRALTELDRGGADVLMVSKLDRLSRDLGQGIEVMNRAQSTGKRKKKWSLVVIDYGIDTTTPSGEFMANIDLSRAQYERRLIGVRTKDALKAKKDAGVRLGRPQALPDDVVQRIVRMREAGLSLPAIAKQLEDDEVPTARGGSRWYPSAVKAVCESQAGVRLAS
jgi:DNA invertase Pin-like site-specific DNA recombinase